MDKRISFVFWIAAMKNSPMTYKKACSMSRQFSLAQLERIYKLTKQAA